MSNPIAVLLIVGSAVIGPIEAQPAPVPPPYSVFEFAPGLGGSKPCMSFDKRTCVMETLPELCERAMQEIGAKDTWANEPLRDKWNGWIMPDSTRVRCIPVPAGYRK